MWHNAASENWTTVLGLPQRKTILRLGKSESIAYEYTRKIDVVYRDACLWHLWPLGAARFCG